MWKFAGLLWCLLAVWAAPAEAKKADPARVDSLLAAAADTGLSRKERVRVLKKAVGYDRSGRAMHALARHHLSGGKRSSRRDAARWLERAIEREPENADYLATYAELLWRNRSRRNSYAQARKAMVLDANNVRALYWAGRYATWSWEMSRYTEAEAGDDARASQRGAVAGRTFRHTDYDDIELDVGVELLTRALEIDPDHRPSRMLLGLVYCEAMMPDELVDLFSDYRARHPEDWDACFFAGLGHQMRGDLDSAYGAYTEGLAHMPEPDRRFMQSIFMMRSRKDQERGEPLPDEGAIQRFWFGRDPLFLTPVNERLLEQCRRVAYTNLRFSDPRNGYEGWKTDRGQAYIRYGKPLSRSMVAADIDLGLDATPEESEVLARQASVGPFPWKFRPRVEAWGYEGFQLMFLNTNSWDSWRFGEAWVGQERMGFADLVERIPDSYRYPHQYDVPRQIAQFRRDEGKTWVEVYYALPGEYVAHRKAGPGVEAVDIRQALFLFDTAWDSLRGEVRQVQQMPWVTYRGTQEGYLFAGEQLTLDPGTYYLAGEAEDRTTKKVGTFRDTLAVRRFGTDTLEVSDLLLARRIVEREDGPFGREQFMILPNPLRQCSREGSVSFYFEVYNLARDAFGATHYRMTYQMRVLPEKWGEGPVKPEWTTAVSHTMRGTRTWEPHHLTLDLDGASAGLRAIRVMVDDLQDLEQAVAMSEFRVMW